MHRRWWVAFVVLVVAGSVGLVRCRRRRGAGRTGAGRGPTSDRPGADPLAARRRAGATSCRTGRRTCVDSLDGAAIADLSTRAPKLRNRLADNYASLGAGDKAVGARGASDAAGMEPAGARRIGVDELLGTTTAGSVFTRRTGRAAGAGPRGARRPAARGRERRHAVPRHGRRVRRRARVRPDGAAR